MATSPTASLRIVIPIVETPERALTRSDGELATVPHAWKRGPATRRVLDAAQTPGRRRPPADGLQGHPAVVRGAVTEVERTARLTLDPGQRALADGFVMDDRRIVAALGPPA